MLGLTGEAPAHWETRSHLLWAFIHAALRKGLDDYAIVDACVGAARDQASVTMFARMAVNPMSRTRLNTPSMRPRKSDGGRGTNNPLGGGNLG